MAELVLIFGPCGVGKTTYARTHYPAHLHVDREALMHTLFAHPATFRYHSYIRSCGRVLAEQATRHLLAKQQSVCVPMSGATRAERATWISLAHEFGATVTCVRLLASAETCISRAKMDATRPATSKSKWAKIVAHWFRDFEPVDCDLEGIATYKEIDNG